MTSCLQLIHLTQFETPLSIPLLWNHTQQYTFQMEIPLGNFFEVKVNASQLSTFHSSTNKQLREHWNAICQMKRKIASQNATQREEFMIEFERARKARDEDKNYMKLYMQDIDKKQNQRSDQLQEAIRKLSKKVDSMKEGIEDEIKEKVFYLESKINTEGLEELKQVVRAEGIQLRSHINMVQEQHTILDQTVQKNLIKHEQLNKMVMERIQELSDEGSNQSQIIDPKDTQFASWSRKKDQEERDKMLEDSLRMMATVHARSSRTDNGVRQSIVANSRVQRTSQRIIQAGYSGNEKSDKGVKELEKQLTKKIEKLEESMQEKMGLFEKYINRVDNKNTIIDEHIGILTRKIEKQKTKISELSDGMKRFQDRKMDQQVIETMKSSIKKITKDLEEGLDLKIDKETYERDRKHQLDKTHYLGNSIMDKAEKADVRKGLSFLEEKIKEIIIVLSEQRSQNPDGALKKTPFKCLSCDKDLEVDKENPKTGTALPTGKQTSIRCTTNHMRKRIRMMNNNSVGHIGEA